MRLLNLSNHFKATAALALAFSATAFAQTVDNKPKVKEEVLEKVTHHLQKNAFVPGIDFTKWEDFLKENREQIDAAGNDEEFQRAVNSALAKFGASHIVLTTPRQADVRRTGATVGVGISTQIVPEGIIVVRVIEGASAAEAGIVPGDIIVKVDGKPVEGIKGIPGEEGTFVTLEVKRNDGTLKEFRLQRKKFSTVRKEDLTWIDADTAKIHIPTFDFAYDRENVENLFREAKKAKNLILDLRDNGGGAVLNLEHLLGLLMNPEQPIGTFIDRRTVSRYVDATGGSSTNLEGIALWSTNKVRPRRNRNITPYVGNVFVLINGLSGSASEIAAAALQENVGAKVVGAKSAGAVLVSVILPAAHGFMIQYPLMDYVTIRGRRLEGNGVMPDVEAKDPVVRLPNTPDPSVEACKALVAKMKEAAGKSGNR